MFFENFLSWIKHDWTTELICWSKLRWLSQIIPRFPQELLMFDERGPRWEEIKLWESESGPIIIISDLSELNCRKFDAIQLLISAVRAWRLFK